MVGETVEQGGCEFLVSENLDPLTESQVGGNDSCALFVALRQQIEQQFAARALKWHEAQFVDY